MADDQVDEIVPCTPDPPREAHGAPSKKKVHSLVAEPSEPGPAPAAKRKLTYESMAELCAAMLPKQDDKVPVEVVDSLTAITLGELERVMDVIKAVISLCRAGMESTKDCIRVLICYKNLPGSPDTMLAMTLRQSGLQALKDIENNLQLMKVFVYLLWRHRQMPTNNGIWIERDQGSRTQVHFLDFAAK